MKVLPERVQALSSDGITRPLYPESTKTLGLLRSVLRLMAAVFDEPLLEQATAVTLEDKLHFVNEVLSLS